MYMSIDKSVVTSQFSYKCVHILEIRHWLLYSWHMSCHIYKNFTRFNDCVCLKWKHGVITYNCVYTPPDLYSKLYGCDSLAQKKHNYTVFMLCFFREYFMLFVSVPVNSMW